MNSGAGAGWGTASLRNAARFEDLQRKVADMRAGRIFPAGDVDLTADGTATTTTVTAQGCTTRSTVVLMPREAGAAAEIGAGFLFVEPGTGAFVINHSASEGVRQFRWAILGPANVP